MKIVEVKENELKEFRADGHFSVLYTNGKVSVYSSDNFDSDLAVNEKHYEHDCDKCIFLGNWVDYKKGRTFDLYFCSQDGLPTVLARYGNEEFNYYSGLNMSGIEPLVVAEGIAKDFKLLNNKKGI